MRQLQLVQYCAAFNNAEGIFQPSVIPPPMRLYGSGAGRAAP